LFEHKEVVSVSLRNILYSV